MKLLDISTPKYPNVFTKVDDDDYVEQSKYKWNAWRHRDKLYVQRRIGWKPSRLLQLHREILSAPSGLVVDHIDGDSLNNQRANLRLCTNRENVRNSISRNGVSKYKGVSKHANTTKWRAYIASDRKQTHLGYFTSEEAAARAYDIAAKSMWGQFARCNFP